MKDIKMRLAILGVFGLASSQVFAAGSLCALAAAPSGSAYINAYNDGRVIPPLSGPATTVLLARSNFGSTQDGGSAGLCEITGLANDTVSPLAGYTLRASTNRVLPSVTGGSTAIGTVIDRVWRKPAATAPATATDMCIFGTEVSNLTNTDHDSGTAGIQLFEVNDIARGGFSASGTVNVGYFVQAANPSRAYRVGRTFTSVQHRAYIYGGGTLEEQQNNGSGYLDLPTIGGSTTLNINGVNTPLPANTVTPAASATEQQAAVNSNWVDFTTDAVYRDDDGYTNNISAMTYVQAACDSTAPSGWVKTGAIRVRQTAQESTTFKEINIDGYAPPGATVP